MKAIWYLSTKPVTEDFAVSSVIGNKSRQDKTSPEYAFQQNFLNRIETRQ